MTNVKRTLKKTLIFIFIGCILCNLNILNDIRTNTDYNDLSWEELPENYAVAEFVHVDKIEDAPAGAFNYYVGYLTNGKKVILYFYKNIELLEINTLAKGMFSAVPEDKEYLVNEYETEDVMFWYMGENYFHVSTLSYIAFSIGLAGIVFSILFFLLKKSNINISEMLPSVKKETGGILIKRDSNFELLRILCIIMVIMQHFGYWGDFFILGRFVRQTVVLPDGEIIQQAVDFVTDLSMNTVILQTIVNVGKIGVNCFMLITGYYMVKSKFKMSKVFRLAATVWFYSWGLGILFVLWNHKVFDMKSFLQTVLPVLFGQYWFITIYLIVYILSPFLNAVAQNVDKNTFKRLLFFLYMIWSVIPTAVSPGWNVTNTGWMVLMYLTGGYFRLYGNENVKKKWHCLGGCLVSYAMLMIMTVVIDIYGTRVVYQQSIAQKDDILIAACSLLLFLFFRDLKIEYSRLINTLSACSFGVYLIHENVLVKRFLWTDWIRNNQYFDSKFFVVYAIGVIISVYFVCVFIEWLRQRAVYMAKKISSVIYSKLFSSL